MNKRKKIILLIVAIVLIAYPGSYLLVLNSDAALVGEKFIRSNSPLISEIGEVNSITLSPLGYAIEFSGSSGSADLTYWVDGENGKTEVSLQIEMRMNVWNIQKGNYLSKSGKVLDLL